MNKHEKLSYVEFASKDLSATKQFFSQAFGWTFKDYGDEYTSFSDQGLNGGFYKADLTSRAESGGALLVFYSDNIQDTMVNVISAGGEVVRPLFYFPGGCRFHFVEPSGNEFAVWAEN